VGEQSRPRACPASDLNEPAAGARAL
jgi:hypothetical protein